MGGGDKFGNCGEFVGFFEKKMDHATRTKDLFGRKPNNEQRKQCYQEVASELDYKQRRPLPGCVVAKVRQIYPDHEGRYMGFHDC